MKDNKTALELFQPDQNPLFSYLYDQIESIHYDLLVKYKYDDMDVMCLKKRIVQIMIFDELKTTIRDFLVKEYKYEWMQATAFLNNKLNNAVREWIKDGKIQKATELTD